jgi:hypothetical protein
MGKITPNELGRELSRSPKTIRRILRYAFPRLEWEKYTRWYLTEDQANVVRRYFDR